MSAFLEYLLAFVSMTYYTFLILFILLAMG